MQSDAGSPPELLAGRGRCPAKAVRGYEHEGELGYLGTWMCMERYGCRCGKPLP